MISGNVSKMLTYRHVMGPLIFMVGAYATVILVCTLSVILGFWCRCRSLYACACEIQELGTSPPKVIVQIIVILCIVGSTAMTQIITFCYSYNTKGMAKDAPHWLRPLVHISYGYSHTVLLFPFALYVVLGKIIYHQFTELNNLLENYLISSRFLQTRGEKTGPTSDADVDLDNIYYSFVKLRCLYEELWGSMFFPVLSNNVFTLTFCISLVFRIVRILNVGINYEIVISTVFCLVLVSTIYCQGHVADMINEKVRTRL